jgi:hypothetical protein
MRRIVHAATILSLAVGINSCAYSPTVRGRYPWTEADTIEVNRLIRQRKDVRKPVEDVEMLGPNRALISSGRLDLEKSPQYQSTFRVHRVAGHWVIEESSISEMERRILKPSEGPFVPAMYPR